MTARARSARPRHRGRGRPGEQMGGELGILESFVDFACEISVDRRARRQRQPGRPIPPVENQHVNHVLDTTIAPARIPRNTAMRRRGDRAPRRTKSSDLVGMLAVEMFVTADGAAAGQRARAAAAQFRALDDRRLRHQPVRAARARGLRPAARLGRASLRRGDEEPAWATTPRNGASR